MVFWNKKARAPARAPAVDDPQVRREPEVRSGITESVNLSDAEVVTFFGGAAAMTDEIVTINSAMQVPEIQAAVGFLSRTLAALPIKVFEKVDGGREARPDDPVHGLLNRAVNDEQSAFDFRRKFWHDVFTIGRGIAFIEVSNRGELLNLWPLEVNKVTIERTRGRTRYHYLDGSRRVTYGASEVIDLAFMPGTDRLSAFSPIYSNANTIGLALAVVRYGSRFFRNGGIPPFTISGPVKTPGGVARAAADLSAAVAKQAAEGGNAVVVPDGHTLSPLGFDPEKMQMVETQRFLVEKFARIYSMPPVFLQDLTHGSFSNTEQQDLQLVKHLVTPWATAFEAEANLKLFGRDGGAIYAEHNVDALMRGDVKTRAEATARRINTGQLTINEARERENLPPVSGGGVALVQGAMVPATMAGAAMNQAAPAAKDEGQD